MRLAASLERGSEHPLATAILKGAEERGLKLGTPVDFASETGKGVVGVVEGVQFPRQPGHDDFGLPVEVQEARVWKHGERAPQCRVASHERFRLAAPARVLGSDDAGIDQRHAHRLAE